MRYFLKDEKGDLVNTIEWDGVSEWTLPAKHTIELDTRPTILESTLPPPPLPVVVAPSLTDMILADPKELAKLKQALGIA